MAATMSSHDRAFLSPAQQSARLTNLTQAHSVPRRDNNNNNPSVDTDGDVDMDDEMDVNSQASRSAAVHPQPAVSPSLLLASTTCPMGAGRKLALPLGQKRKKRDDDCDGNGDGMLPDEPCHKRIELEGPTSQPAPVFSRGGPMLIGDQHIAPTLRPPLLSYDNRTTNLQGRSGPLPTYDAARSTPSAGIAFPPLCSENGENSLGRRNDYYIAANDKGDMMRLDDTPNKVYIYDLAAEVAAAEAEERQQHKEAAQDTAADDQSWSVTSLQELVQQKERRHVLQLPPALAAVPPAILRPDDQGAYLGLQVTRPPKGDSDDNDDDNVGSNDSSAKQLIVYARDGAGAVPRTLTSPAESDGVRRAFLESRRRRQLETEMRAQRRADAEQRVALLEDNLATSKWPAETLFSGDTTRARDSGLPSGEALAGSLLAPSATPVTATTWCDATDDWLDSTMSAGFGPAAEFRAQAQGFAGRADGDAMDVDDL